jgi:hypothetical protein
MRAFILVLTLACAAAWGGDMVRAAPPPPGLDVLWANPYEYDWLTYGFSSSGGHDTQDDFTLENSGVVKGFECWFIYETDHPKPFTATIRYDTGGDPAGTLWTADITDVTDTDTGDDWSGFNVYRTELLLEEDDYVFVEAGTTFWLELYWTGVPSGSWLCEDIGNLHFDGDIYDFSAFFIILGTPSGEDVQTASWGEIKATF